MSEYLDKYLATDLTIHLPTGSFLLTDKTRRDALLKPPQEFINTTWIVITAWNPGSDATTTFEQNAKAQTDLRIILEARGFGVFAARGDDPDPASGFEGEEMLAVAVYEEDFVSDLADEFIDLAFDFGQNAFFSVVGNLLRVHPGLEPGAISERVKQVVKLS
jgi:hypothetical protein